MQSFLIQNFFLGIFFPTCPISNLSSPIFTQDKGMTWSLRREGGVACGTPSATRTATTSKKKNLKTDGLSAWHEKKRKKRCLQPLHALLFLAPGFPLPLLAWLLFVPFKYETQKERKTWGGEVNPERRASEPRHTKKKRKKNPLEWMWIVEPETERMLQPAMLAIGIFFLFARSLGCFWDAKCKECLFACQREQKMNSNVMSRRCLVLLEDRMEWNTDHHMPIVIWLGHAGGLSPQKPRTDWGEVKRNSEILEVL